MPMLEYLDPELRDFIDQYVTSFLAWDILVFFHKNPGTADNTNDLSMKLGRRAEDIERAARDLAAKSVLRADNSLYRYIADDNLRDLIGKFTGALEDREKRLLILTAVLQKR